MTDPPLRYVDTAVTQQEVPDEISLIITISNCRYRCPGCHSPYLQRDIGEPLLPALDALIAPYEGLITCLCLMGEGQYFSELKRCLGVAKARGLKTCLYSGCESVEPFAKQLPLLDYLKVGGYREEAGGLDSPATNQRFYRIDGKALTDITAQFSQKKGILMSMTPESLKKKYGDAAVMGVDASLVKDALKDGYTCRKDAMVWIGGVCFPLKHIIQREQKPRLRCEAELDPAFKQIIPYIILEHTGSDRVFVTLRIGGDERLRGQASMGLGGHIDDGEAIHDALRRELAEEVGLQKDDIANVSFCGYIYSEQSEVDSVHIGMVYRLLTDREDISCLESDKLTGQWYAQDELRALREENKMESWSEIIYDHLFHAEEDDNANL